MNETDHFTLTDYVTAGLKLERIQKSLWQDLSNVEAREVNVSYNPSVGKISVQVCPQNRPVAPGDIKTYSDKYMIVLHFRSAFDVLQDENSVITMSPPCIAFGEKSIVKIALAGFRITDTENLSSVYVEARLSSSVTRQRLDAPPVDPDARAESRQLTNPIKKPGH